MPEEHLKQNLEQAHESHNDAAPKHSTLLAHFGMPWVPHVCAMNGIRDTRDFVAAQRVSKLAAP